MEPHHGCGLIGGIGEKLDHPMALADFVHLAHLQEGHEEFGFTKEPCLPDILAACRELLAGQAQPKSCTPTSTARPTPGVG